VLTVTNKKGLQMRLFTFAATVCIALLSTAAVAGECDARKELQALALNIYYESRGEPEEGMRMVGEVTINRVASLHYPDTICDVVYQKGQFSWVSSRKSKTPKEIEAWEKSLEIAKDLLDDNVTSYSHLATHFINKHDMKHLPRWVKRFTKVETIGDHTFYRM
jgi:spore germination cell wall hydrolase CwlJ-like protein